MIETTFAGETLVLLRQRAAWWPRARTLFITDTHFGKAAAYRHAGVPVPESVTGADAERLEALCASLRPEHLVILGDFFHAPSGRVPLMEGRVAAWRDRCPPTALRVTLVRGNHDLASGDPPAAWGFECVDPGVPLGPFTLAHAPEEAPAGRPTLVGHVHPGVVLRGSTDAARLRCFIHSDSLFILPAFGGFTGMGVLRPRKSDRVFVVTDEGVLDVSPGTGPRGQASSTPPPARYHAGMTSEAQP